MIELGKKQDVEGKSVTDLQKLSEIYRKPTSMPRVKDDESVICLFDRGIDQKLYVCESLADMQQLYDSYAQGWALHITWYKGKVKTNIAYFELGPDEGLAGQIINDFAPNAPQEVKRALAAYALGNPGAARVLAECSKNFKTAKEVEKLVGWPLSEHNLERTADIWNRFK